MKHYIEVQDEDFTEFIDIETIVIVKINNKSNFNNKYEISIYTDDGKILIFDYESKDERDYRYDEIKDKLNEVWESEYHRIFK